MDEFDIADDQKDEIQALAQFIVRVTLRELIGGSSAIELGQVAHAALACKWAGKVLEEKFVELANADSSASGA